MNKYLPYLGIAAALAVVAALGFLSGPLQRSPGVSTDVPSETSTPVRQTPLSETAPAAVKKAVAPAVSLEEVKARLTRAAVNIVCYAPRGSGLHSITGSGIVIDPKGMVLTNAHVAQYLLLEDRGATCVVRSGSPAEDRYHARLAYISPFWVLANPTVLTAARPVGTGEYDFALLAITESATDEPLPSSFDHIPLGAKAPLPGANAVVASYGAEALPAGDISAGLYPTAAFVTVRRVYTFKTNTTDVLDLGGSAAAQEGSSGGGVADGSGALVGTLTTSTVEGALSSRSLGAITAPYIRRAYKEETGEPLDALLARDPKAAADDFAYRIPALQSIITAQLR